MKHVNYYQPSAISRFQLLSASAEITANGSSAGMSGDARETG